MASSRVLLSSLFVAPLCGALLSAACGTSSFTGAGTADDAGTDAAGDGSTSDASAFEAGNPFCPALSPAPYFCADFDQADLGYGYLNGESRDVFDFAGDGGTVDAGPSDDSPPFELVSLLASSAAGSVAQLDTHDQIPPAKNATTYHLDLDFKIESIGNLDANTPMTIFNLYIMSTGLGLPDASITPSSIDCELSGNNIQISTGGTPVTFGGRPTPGHWIHAHVDAVIQGLERSSAEIDGITRDFGVVSSFNATTTAARVRLGLASAAANQTLSVSFDNVELTFDTGDAGDGG